jgi:hypothetical protein
MSFTRAKSTLSYRHANCRSCCGNHDSLSKVPIICKYGSAFLHNSKTFHFATIGNLHYLNIVVPSHNWVGLGDEKLKTHDAVVHDNGVDLTELCSSSKDRSIKLTEGTCLWTETSAGTETCPLYVCLT